MPTTSMWRTAKLRLFRTDHDPAHRVGLELHLIPGSRTSHTKTFLRPVLRLSGVADYGGIAVQLSTARYGRG